jgi:hypothetical protein
MRFSFHAAHPFKPFNLLPGHKLTISDEHPGWFEVSYRVPANYGLALGALVGGELVDRETGRAPAEVADMVRMVAGLPRPNPLRPQLRLLE